MTLTVVCNQLMSDDHCLYHTCNIRVITYHNSHVTQVNQSVDILSSVIHMQLAFLVISSIINIHTTS